MRPFKLYDWLASLGPLPAELAWHELLGVGRNLSSEESEVLYALILHHRHLHLPGHRGHAIPYGGRAFDLGKGILFDIRRLPPELQAIIGHYINSAIRREKS